MVFQSIFIIECCSLAKKHTMIILGIISAILYVALIWSVIDIRNRIEKSTAMHTAIIRLLSKIAENTGGNKDEINKVLEELSKKL